MARQAPPPTQSLPAVRVKKAYNYTQKTGRPRKYETPTQLQHAVDEYFESCWETDMVKQKDDEGIYFEEKRKQIRPYTITGLALHLGMTRENILHYTSGKTGQEDELFSIIMTQAKLKCQNYAEEQTFRTNGQVIGPMFNLKANYGWKETTVKEVTGPEGSPLFPVEADANERARQARAQMLAALGEE